MGDLPRGAYFFHVLFLTTGKQLEGRVIKP
jgi:hypothetical protein